MSLDDRDYWREDRKKKEKLYGGDWSLNSKPIKSICDYKSAANKYNNGIAFFYLFIVVAFIGLFIAASIGLIH